MHLPRSPFKRNEGAGLEGGEFDGDEQGDRQRFFSCTLRGIGPGFRFREALTLTSGVPVRLVAFLCGELPLPNSISASSMIIRYLNITNYREFLIPK